MRRLTLGAVVLVLWAASAVAHDIVDAVAMEDYLARIDSYREAIADGDRQERAEAHFALGETLGESVALLNRDLVAHGGEHGVVPTVYIAELDRRGIDLEDLFEAGRYRSVTEPYRTYLDLAPEGARAADARFRLLEAGFYDSFDYDPFAADRDWSELLAEIELAETLIRRHPDHPGHEEAAFILAVDYCRAARSAPDEDTAARYRDRAVDALERFRERYPESLRAATASALLRDMERL